MWGDVTSPTDSKFDSQKRNRLNNYLKIRFLRHDNGGERGIRTLEGDKPLPVFKTGAFNRSAISPLVVSCPTQCVAAEPDCTRTLPRIGLPYVLARIATHADYARF